MPAGNARSACCCLGMVGNTHYMCLARGLDLDPPHCGAECPQRPGCTATHNAAAQQFERRFPGLNRPVAVKPSKRGRHARR